MVLETVLVKLAREVSAAMAADAAMFEEDRATDIDVASEASIALALFVSCPTAVDK